MSNPLRYIRALEAAGFDRNQAEAQVQVVLDALEGDLVTKSDFAVFQERLENRFAQIDQRFEIVDQRFLQMKEFFIAHVRESEFRIVTRLSAAMIATATIGISILTWLIKI